MLDLVSVDAPLEVFSQIGLVFLFFLAGLEIAFDATGERHLNAVAVAFAVSLVLAVLVAIILAATSFGSWWPCSRTRAARTRRSVSS